MGVIALAGEGKQTIPSWALRRCPIPRLRGFSHPHDHLVRWMLCPQLHLADEETEGLKG